MSLARVSFAGGGGFDVLANGYDLCHLILFETSAI